MRRPSNNCKNNKRNKIKNVKKMKKMKNIKKSKTKNSIITIINKIEGLICFFYIIQIPPNFFFNQSEILYQNMHILETCFRVL